MKKLLAVILGVCVVAAVVLWLGKSLQSFPLAPVEWESSAPEEITDIGSPNKFYYNLLDDKEKHTYNAILSEIFDMPARIDIPNIDGFQLEEVFSALLSDNPELFFLSRVCSLEDYSLKYDRFVPQYAMTKDEYEKRMQQLGVVMQSVEAGFTAPEDDWQTELEIHDFIVSGCEYLLNSADEGDSTSSAYGALVEGKASCEGYSKAMKMLLDRAGIENAVVSGEATNPDGETVNHMWNAVFVSGSWYYVDCTWDDPVSESDSNIYGHTYFNITTDLISVTHSGFSFDFACTEMSENYHVRKGLYFEFYDSSCQGRLEDVIAAELTSGNGRIEIRFADEQAYSDATEQLFEDEDRSIDEVLYHVMQITDVEFSEYFEYVPDDYQYVLTLVIAIEE